MGTGLGRRWVPIGVGRVASGSCKSNPGPGVLSSIATVALCTSVLTTVTGSGEIKLWECCWSAGK